MHPSVKYLLHFSYDFPGWGSPAASICRMQSSRVHPHSIRGAHGVKGLGILLGLGKVKGAEAGDAHGVHKVYVGLAHDDAAVAALRAGLQLALGEVPGIWVLNDDAEGHGGADDAVAVGHLAHLHGGKQMLEFHDNQTKMAHWLP